MQAEIDKARLLDLLEAEYEFVHRTIDDLSGEIMLTNNVSEAWSIKDTIAHLTARMVNVLKWLGYINQRKYQDNSGESPIIPKSHYEKSIVNATNKEQWEQDKDRSLDDILAHFHDTYHVVYNLTEVMTEEELFINTYDGLLLEPVWRLIAENTYEHFHEHIKPVREWLAKNL